MGGRVQSYRVWEPLVDRVYVRALDVNRLMLDGKTH